MRSRRPGSNVGEETETTPEPPPGQGEDASPSPHPPPQPPPQPHPHARRDAFLRRGLKFAGLLILVYYLLPKKVFGVPVYWAIPLGAAIVLVVEVARVTGVLPIPALRAYEHHRPAGYVYWGAALALLVAFFPESFAVSALIAASVADVIAGELRRGWKMSGGRSRAIGVFLPFTAVAGALLFWLSPEGAVLSLLLGATGAVLAAAVEGRVMGWLDDDLLMPILPALLWIGLVAVLPGATPLGFHLPWMSRG